ncbi:MAG: translation initiation factor IF-2 [Clostridiales bacterium]|nr:translation initiation factor IF-2 [Clostridiales bacterium]
MAKAKFIDSAKELEAQAKELFERIKKTHTDMGATLQDVRRAEGKLIEKERAAEKARIETERAERLRELLNSDGSLAFHVGEPDEPVSVPGEEPKKEEPKKEEAKKEEPAKAAPAPAEAAPKAEEKPAPKAEEPKLQPVKEPEKPVEQPKAEKTQEAQKPAPAPAEKPQNAKPAPAEPRRQSEQRPRQQGGYQQGNVQQRGEYQPRTDRQPRQAGKQGGYQARPISGNDRPPRQAGQQGGYQQRTPGQQGGFERRTPGQQGGFERRNPAAQTGDRPRPQAPRSAAAPAPITGGKEQRTFDPNKNQHSRTRDDERNKTAKNKKAIMKETAPSARGWDDEGGYGTKKKKKQQQAPVHKPEPVKIEKAVITSDTITVKELSEKIGKPAAEIIKKLFILGIMATINQEIDFDTCSLIAADYGIELEHNVAKTFEEVLLESSDEADESKDLVERPPVVTIMGHVDHGKTSLLDAIRNSSVTEGEAGGITQHIGAYTVTCNGKTITFIDTPGHEAFTSMRARGAQVTDIVILVVAADDGIMPQTVEAINHAKAAEVPIIVAINKMDKDTANPERVKQQLTEHGLVTEEWGGDTICVPVSAKKQMGLDNLLEMILLQAEVLELKANPNRIAKGTIIEAELDKGRGPIATVLVQTGTLKIGDPIVAGTAYGRVRAMVDDKGKRVNKAGPSQPVEVLGFSEVPSAGDILNVAEIDKLSRQVAEERRDKQKAEQLKNLSKVSLDDLFNQIAEGEIKDLNIIVKADVQGSVEAVKQALEKLSNEEVRVRCIHGGVGAITGSDIMFASASNAIIIGFNVRPDAAARTAAEKEKVDMRLYRVIYNAIEDIEKAMKGLFKPVFEENTLGRISVRNTFKVSGVGTIAGAYVQDGKVTRNAQIRVVRDGIVIHEGKIASLKRFKDDAKEVNAGYECGIGIENFNDIREGDTIEAFEMVEVKR